MPRAAPVPAGGVGACGGALTEPGTDRSYCARSNNGPWKTGTGAACDATSTNGAVGAWDVARVTTMRYIFWYAEAFDQAVVFGSYAFAERQLSATGMFANNSRSRSSDGGNGGGGGSSSSNYWALFLAGSFAGRPVSGLRRETVNESTRLKH